MILAIDSSSLVATVALADEEKVYAEYSVNQKKTHSQTLLPMIDEIFRMTGIEKKSIEAVAITGGPGSFTGLRIGGATAKGIALALEIPIIHVPTLNALANNIQYTDKVICPIMDARRNQVYTGIYENIAGCQKVLMEQKPLDIVELISELEKIGKPCLFLGDGVPVYKEIIDEKMKLEHHYANINNAVQSAASLADLAIRYLKEGKTVSSDEFVPDYLRLSQAEREKKSK